MSLDHCIKFQILVFVRLPEIGLFVTAEIAIDLNPCGNQAGRRDENTFGNATLLIAADISGR